jgi:hypothetical protein
MVKFKSWYPRLKGLKSDTDIDVTIVGRPGWCKCIRPCVLGPACRSVTTLFAYSVDFEAWRHGSPAAHVFLQL